MRPYEVRSKTRILACLRAYIYRRFFEILGGSAGNRRYSDLEELAALGPAAREIQAASLRHSEVQCDAEVFWSKRKPAC